MIAEGPECDSVDEIVIASSLSYDNAQGSCNRIAMDPPFGRKLRACVAVGFRFAQCIFPTRFYCKDAGKKYEGYSTGGWKQNQQKIGRCQAKVEMSYFWQSRNVLLG